MWNGNAYDSANGEGGDRPTTGTNGDGTTTNNNPPPALDAVAALASFSNSVAAAANFTNHPLAHRYHTSADFVGRHPFSDGFNADAYATYPAGGFAEADLVAAAQQRVYEQQQQQEVNPFARAVYSGPTDMERRVSSQSATSSAGLTADTTYGHYTDTTTNNNGDLHNNNHYADGPPAAAKVFRSPETASVSSADGYEEDEAPASPDYSVEPPQPAPRGKPEAMAKALAASIAEEEREKQQKIKSPKPKKSASKSSSPKSASKKGGSKKKKSTTKSKPTSLFPSPSDRHEFLVGERVPTITPEQYQNLQELMTQFCRVPLLAEFSRPVSLLHPEVSNAYNKIISHPIDLGHICRGIRRREYKNLRDVRLDVWLVFSNCVKYNSHSSNKEAVPSFVSIALHLREYFNNLWQEYMLPSDQPPPSEFTDLQTGYLIVKSSFEKRDNDRQRRLDNSGVLVMSKSFTRKGAYLLKLFVESGGRVDGLDKDALFRTENGENGGDVDVIVERLRMYQEQLQDVAESGTVDYTLEAFYTDLRKCYTEDVLEDDTPMRNRFSNRIGRFFWKLAAPLHEANSRGVTQSSIWGNIAATIWARESQKKPYWPALCLGILPPAEQREGWHQAVTERNEARLPEKLRDQLMVAKKRCEQAQKRQSLSYFLVEFLGTHEFIWVRETDIVENFDPESDPNKNIKVSSKKSRSSRNSAAAVIGSQMYETAIEECLWANDEYENVLQDAFEIGEDGIPREDSDQEENYSYQLLSQSDDEADQEYTYDYQYNEDEMGVSDVDEANYLISHDGLLDNSAEGRRNAKKRTMAMKKKKATTTTKVKTADSSKKKSAKGQTDTQTDRQMTKEQRELERRRKKRGRERDRVRKSDAKKLKAKRRRSGSDAITEDGERGLNRDKRARATAIVKAYLTRLVKDEDGKSLALGGVLTLPAANVESTGLLGMALAFRAACGELKLPDDGQEQIKKFSPWLAIDAESPKTSAERVTNLKKQSELLEKEIERVNKDTEQRRQLALEYVAKRQLLELEVEADDHAARLNHYKKRKKSVATPKADAGEEAKADEGMTESNAKKPPEDKEDDNSATEVETTEVAVEESAQVGRGTEEPVVEAMVVDDAASS